VERETTTEPELADRTFGYDPAGNITKVADTPEGRVADVQCFGYDHLRRMTDAWTPSSGDCGATKSTTALGGAAPYWHSWEFDKTGNRRTETQHSAAGDTTRTTGYPPLGDPQPHTATSVLTVGPNGQAEDTFVYDATGRTTSRVIGGDTQTIDYDAEGRVSRIVNRDGMPDQTESTYLYDADGQRLISRELSATTLYVFGQEIRLENGTTTPSWTRWYSHGGQTVAVRNSVTGLKWLAPDHQGTNQLSIANDNALTATQRRQTPYGASRGTAPPAWPDRLGFVGGRNDESGLTQVGARLYDQSSGRFLSADPVVDNNDPQQLNGYAYANNSPVTFSDPTGLLKDCGPDGVLCGYNSSLHQSRESYEQERQTYLGRERAWQQANRNNQNALKSGLASEGISWEDYQRALADAHKTKWDVIKEVAWEVLKEISGWNDIVDCFSKGDIWACGGLVAGLVPWGKVGKILEAGYNAVKAVGRLTGIIDKAKGVLRRAQTIADNVTRAATEQFQKLTSKGGGSCAKHSFVATTLVLMADGSTKPISDIELGDKVKATDPTTGHTTDRAVVATIVHDDEGDMTKLTVAAEDGTTGSVDATSWHPVWVDAEDRFVNIGDLKPGRHLTSADGTSPQVTAVDRYKHYEPVYDLTVDGLHTYYVRTATTSVLVHNCPPSQNLLDEADKAEVAGAEFAAEYTSPSGQTYRSHNKEKIATPNGMFDVFDEFNHHGGCAETKCLIKAYNAEGPDAICGGHMDVVHVSDTDDWSHGDVARPCGRCARLQGGLFIG
jgi:RHS repeat-associated protein